MDKKQDSSEEERAAERRPYVAPAIEETSEFETLALTCAGASYLACSSLPGGYTAS